MGIQEFLTNKHFHIDDVTKKKFKDFSIKLLTQFQDVMILTFPSVVLELFTSPTTLWPSGMRQDTSQNMFNVLLEA